MIIDAHVHLPSVDWPGHPEVFATVRAAIDYLRTAGTDGIIFNTWQGVLAETEDDLNQANAAALAVAEEYPDFVYPGAALHPAYPKVSLRWLARFRALGYMWVGELVNYQKPYNYTDEAFMHLCSQCAEHSHILQLHGHKDVLVVARRFPEMPVVHSHILPDQCATLAGEKSVWLDISGSCGGLQMGGLEAAYDAFGADRLLYGTDFTGYEPRSFQQRLAIVVPDALDREKILWRNAVRLLESVGAEKTLAPILQGASHVSEVAERMTSQGTSFATLTNPVEDPAPTLLLLSGEAQHTLSAQPYARTGQLLAQRGWRIVSLDLPCHGADRRAGELGGLDGWAARTKQNEDIVAAFQQRVNEVVAYLIEKKLTDPQRIAVAGTSRGGFMAFHCAADNPLIRAAAAFSPVTDLATLTEFAKLKDAPLVHQRNLIHTAAAWANRNIWIVIGAQDERVGTDRAIAYARAVNAAAQHRRSPPTVELVVHSTHGHTSLSAWHDDVADWLERLT